MRETTRRRRDTFKVVWLAALMLAVSGCPLKAPPSHTEVVKQALPPTTSIPPTWSTTANNQVVTDDWLKSFNDPTLNAIVAEAMANNLDLRQAAARVEAAQQIVVVVGAKLWPQVGAQVGGRITIADKNIARQESTDFKEGQNILVEEPGNITESFTSSMTTAGASWELDLWGRLRAQKAASQEDYQAVALDYAYARQSLAATTAKSWYLAIETRQLLDIAENAVKIYTHLLDLTRQRRDAGKVGDFDVVQVSAALATAQSQVRYAQELYSEARRALELLLGRYPAAEIDIRPTFAPLPPPVAAGVPSSLLERRPDIMAAERQVLAAFRKHEAAQLALLPTFSLTVEGGHLSDRLLSLLHLNPWLLHGAIGVEVPIYTGGALIAKIRIATAEQQRAVASYGSVVLQAFGEVEKNLTNEALLAQRLKFVQRSFKDRTKAVELADIKYKAGKIDMLSVLIIQTEQLISQSNVVKLRSAELANRINLHLALGGGFNNAPAATSLFPLTQRMIQQAMKRACRVAKLRARSPHDLRHTYAKILLMDH